MAASPRRRQGRCEPQPADPYADLAASPELGTGADGVRVVEAPDAPAMAPAASSPAIGTGADGVRVVEAPNAEAAAPASIPAPAAPATAAAPVPATAPAAVPATAPAAVPAAVPATAPAPAPTAAAEPHDAAGDALAAALTGAPAPTTTASPSDGPILLARGDVKAALASFGTLAGSIRGAFTPAGVRVDSVAAGSLFAKAGLRAGDVVSAVDGVPLKSLDDAADLYARAGSVKAMNVAVVRGGKPIVLRVTIQ